MGTSQLALYNGALRVCGERRLASLTETRNPRYLLDDVWNDNAVNGCLETGQWSFGRRSQKVNSDPGYTPQFGYQYAFDKPTDWCMTCAVCEDEYYRQPLTRYADEVALWWADINPIYVTFVSSNVSYGGNLGIWPQAFVSYVEAYLATRIVPGLTGDSKKIESVLKWEQMMRRRALSRDASSQPTKFPAQGAWTKARQGGHTNRDGGSNSNLIG